MSQEVFGQSADSRTSDLPDIVALVEASKRSRRMIRLLMMAIGTSLILTLVFAGLAFEAERAASQANTAVYDSCLAVNTERTDQLELWTYLLSLPPSVPPTLAQQAQTAQFKIYISQILASRDCGHP
jgi:hypothetical protein